jgi:hypothetical protein
VVWLLCCFERQVHTVPRVRVSMLRFWGPYEVFSILSASWASERRRAVVGFARGDEGKACLRVLQGMGGLSAREVFLQVSVVHVRTARGGGTFEHTHD